MMIHVDDIDREAEAEVCKRRGHQPSAVLEHDNPAMKRCRWCGVEYDPSQAGGEVIAYEKEED